MNTLLAWFGSGPDIIPLGIFAAALWTLYRCHLASKSGSKKSDWAGRSIPSDENVPIYKVQQFVFVLILAACAVGAAIWMFIEK